MGKEDVVKKLQESLAKKTPKEQEEYFKSISDEISPLLDAQKKLELNIAIKDYVGSIVQLNNFLKTPDNKEVFDAFVIEETQEKIKKSDKTPTNSKEAKRKLITEARAELNANDKIKRMEKNRALTESQKQMLELQCKITNSLNKITSLAHLSGYDMDKFIDRGFNKQSYQSACESYKNISTEKAVEDATASIKEAAKSGASQETVASVINKKVDEFAKKTLIDKAGWSQGAVDIGKFVGGLYLAFKAIGFANDQFPSGLEGLILKVGAAYAAYAGYGKYKGEILNTIKKMTGQDIEDGQNKPSNELSHRKLESEEFQHGEMLFKGILASFKNQSSDKLSKYIVANNFNLVQFIADYSGEEVTLGSVKSGAALVPQQELHADMMFPKDKEYNHIAMIHRQIIDGKGEFHQKSINSYIAGLGFATAPTTVQGFNEAFTTYESIQKVRYNILKKAGLEIDVAAIEKNKRSSEAKSKLITDIDKIVDPKKHLNDNYTLSDTDKNTILAMPGIKESVAQSTELSINEIKEVDDFAKQWNISLTPQSRASLMKAYLSLKNKTIGGIKLDPTYNFMGKAYPALIIGGKIAVPLSISSPTEGTIGYTDTFLNSFNPKGSMGKISAVNQVGFDVLFERALLFANAVSSFAGKGEGKHEDNNGHYKYFDHDPVRGMYFSTNSSLVSSLTTTTKSEQIFGTESLKLAGLTDKTDIDQWLYWINNNFTGKRKIKDQAGERLVAIPLWSINYGINPFAVGVKNENLAQIEMRKQESNIEAFTNTLKGYVSDIGSVGKVFFDATIGATRYVLEKGIMVVKDGAIWTVNSAGDVAQTGLNNVNAKIVGGLMTLGFKTTNGILDILGKNAELFGKVTDSYINQVTTILGNQLDIDNQGSLMQAAQKMIKGGAKITKDSVKPLMEAAEEIAKKGGKTLKDVIKDFGYMETAGAVLGYMGVTGKFQNMVPKDK